MEVEECRYLVVDVEGSGGSPPEIVEIAVVEIANMELTGKKRHWLVRPKKSITPIVSRIHGLKDTDVADAPTITEISEDVQQSLGHAAIVGHNVRIELSIISRSFPQWSPCAAIDTLKLSKMLRPNLGSYGLESVGEALGQSKEAERMTGRSHHSAIYDAALTALIFIELLLKVPKTRRLELLRDADLLDTKQGKLL